MLSLTVFAICCAVVSAQPPVWSPSGCGISKYIDAGNMDLPRAKIVGGIEARPFEFPWQASVRVKSSNQHFCGGTIINDLWILTSADCVIGDATEELSIVVGEHTRSDTESTFRQTLDVSDMFLHESFVPETNQNDICLMKVATPIELNENVQPVCAPDPLLTYEHLKSHVSGWGTISYGGACCPDTLRYVSLNVTTNAFCDSVYASNTISDDMVCASDNYGGNQRGFCEADTGGPLTIKEADGTFRIVGIASWGIGCASGYPGVYCRVGYFNDWITNIINNN